MAFRGETGSERSPAVSFDAFISYSHAADGQLALGLAEGHPAVGQGTIRTARVAGLPRRDGPCDEPASVASDRGGARRLGVVRPARLAYCGGIRVGRARGQTWLARKSVDRILLVVTEGELAFGPTGRIAPATNCLPAALAVALSGRATLARPSLGERRKPARSPQRTFPRRGRRPRRADPRDCQGGSRGRRSAAATPSPPARRRRYCPRRRTRRRVRGRRCGGVPAERQGACRRAPRCRSQPCCAVRSRRRLRRRPRATARSGRISSRRLDRDPLQPAQRTRRRPPDRPLRHLPSG